MKNTNNKAVLLTNLGSPEQPDESSVRIYLNEFLMDPYVIQLPWILRRTIVSLLVLPKRPKSSALAYKSIWSENGSPLIELSKNLQKALQQQVEMPVALAMRYGNPSIEQQIIKLVNQSGIDEILLIPLYPHYADSTVTTSIAKAKQVIKQYNLSVKLKVLSTFYQHPDYISALASSAEPYIDEKFEHILFSYHGLPEKHLTSADPTKLHCLKTNDCCNVSSDAHATCYRHQVLCTTQALVMELGLTKEQYTISFQSRLGRAKWLEPSTETTLQLLAEKGIKHVHVICPAFVTDCLETLEEIAIRGEDVFQKAGGQNLTMIPCLNAHKKWVQTLAKWCKSFQLAI